MHYENSRSRISTGHRAAESPEKLLCTRHTTLDGFFIALLQFGDRIDAELKPWRHGLLAISLFVFSIPHGE